MILSLKYVVFLKSPQRKIFAYIIFSMCDEYVHTHVSVSMILFFNVPISYIIYSATIKHHFPKTQDVFLLHSFTLKTSKVLAASVGSMIFFLYPHFYGCFTPCPKCTKPARHSRDPQPCTLHSAAQECVTPFA